MSIKNQISGIKKWIKKNPVEFWLLIGILLIGAFFRLYKIDQYMTFLGDEGRDVIIVRRIFTELHPPLIGPGTSVGNMYLGPLYYYLMAIPLLLAGFSPIGPAVMVALLGVATIAFIWSVGREWFGKWTGIIAAGLYSISPTVISYSHSSWNPNIMPFFALLCLYSVWKFWKESKMNWLVVMGISYAFVLQSHYLGLLLVPTLFLFWMLTLFNLKKNGNWNMETKKFLKKSLLGFLFFSGLMSPLLAFDLRHGFINSKAIYSFFANGSSTISFLPMIAFSKILNLFNQINYSLLSGKNTVIGAMISFILIVGFVVLLIRIVKVERKNIQKINPAYFLLIAWIFFGLLGLGFYNKSIYDHYLGFLFPAPFILIGVLLSKLVSGKLIFKIVGSLLLVSLIAINLIGNPLRKEPNRLLQRSINVSKVIEGNSGGKPFNLAVIADTNYNDGYEYFFLKDKYPVVDIDSQNPSSITEQLFVVCELLPTSKCDPTHSAKAEVANFGWSKIDKSWEVDGTIVYRLVHSI